MEHSLKRFYNVKECVLVSALIRGDCVSVYFKPHIIFAVISFEFCPCFQDELIKNVLCVFNVPSEYMPCTNYDRVNAVTY